MSRRASMAAPGLWSAGWYRDARRVPSPNFGARPAGAVIDLAVVHSISLPPGVYGGDAIERLFTNRLDPAAHPSFAPLAGLQVSAHFVIRRDGACEQYVSVLDRAWHAGVSSWRGRPNCNDRSLGVELEGLEGHAFEPAQYRTLSRLLRSARARWPLHEVVGHEHIAPGRKRDPGPGFDWPRLARQLRGVALEVPAARGWAPTGMA
ncbi:MAG: 1,6-anhydro-N-acetylmuramyl-L-alanine amidase AmpD [Leptothrix sp. (in: b-proteobacteria)]